MAPGIIGNVSGPGGDDPTRPVFEPVGVSISRQPHTLVDITGPTEAAVLWRASEWLESLDNSVVLLAITWKGNRTDDTDRPEFALEPTVDMSVATAEGRWPPDWFTRPH